jgi:hypothetical protein
MVLFQVSPLSAFGSQMLAQTHLKLANLPAQRAARRASEVSRLGGVRRFAMRRHDEGLLQDRGGSMHNARPNDRCRSSSTARAFRKASRCKGWIGAAAARTALYSSSERLSGMGVLSEARRQYHKPNRGMTGEGAPPRGEGSGPAGFGRSDRNPGPRERTAHQLV